MAGYFREHVYGKGAYEDLAGSSMGAFYDRWLTETYGMTGFQEGQAVLDGLGLVFLPADAVNAMICLSHWELAGAGLCLASIMPGTGDLLSRGGRTALKAGKKLFPQAAAKGGLVLEAVAGKAVR